jgi:hypothetical protein
MFLSPTAACPIRAGRVYLNFKFVRHARAMADASARPRVLAVRHTPGKGVSTPRVALAAVSANSPRLVARAQPEQGSVDFDKLVSGLASALEELAAGAKGAGA